LSVAERCEQERFTQELAFSQPKPNQPVEIRAADGGNFSSATVKIDST
jgi:hypothetical protein